MATYDPYPRRLFWLLTLTLLGWTFWSLSAILLPCVMGAFAAFALWPIVDGLPHKWPRPLRVLAALFVATALVGLFFVILVPGLIAQSQQIAARFPEYLEALTNLAHAAEDLAQRYGYKVNLTAMEPLMRERLQQVGIAIVTWVGSALPGALNNILQLVIAFWVTLYGLLEGPEILQWLNDLLPVSARPAYREAMTIMNSVLRSFLKGMLILGGIIGGAVGLGAWLLGMPYALSIGLVAGALEAVPNIGPIIAAVFAAILAFAHSPWLAVKIIGLFAVIQVLENNLIVPRVLGDSLDVHPMAIFIAVLVGAQLFGLVGVFLAGPVMAVAWRIWKSRTVAPVATEGEDTRS
jgi:predicted PurR-regulated permease PerM